MPPPKSEKLLQKDRAAAQREAQQFAAEHDETVKMYKPGEKIPIKKIKCYNDFVAILQFRVESTIIMAGANGFKNEGMVVGVGPGVPTANGGRTPSQLNIGDVVTFYGNPITSLEPKSGIYQGQKIIIIPERSVICELKPVPYQMMTEEQPGESPS